MTRLTHTTTTHAARDGYEGVDYVVAVTNGDARVSLSLMPQTPRPFTGAGASMTPDDARALAADLMARADEIDPPDDLVVTRWGNAVRVEVKRDDTGETFSAYGVVSVLSNSYAWAITSGGGGHVSTEHEAIDAAAAGIRAHYGVTA